MLRQWDTKTPHWGIEPHATASALGRNPMLLATASAQPHNRAVTANDTFPATLDPAIGYIPGPFGQLSPSPHRILTHTHTHTHTLSRSTTGRVIADVLIGGYMGRE